eukprot:2222483-Lingulodinium_polyedra.AAC.1
MRPAPLQGRAALWKTAILRVPCRGRLRVCESPAVDGDPEVWFEPECGTEYIIASSYIICITPMATEASAASPLMLVRRGTR